MAGFNHIPHGKLVKVARTNGLRNRGKDKARDSRTAAERANARIDEIPKLDIEKILKQTFGDE